MQTYHRTVFEEAPASIQIPAYLQHQRVEVIMLLLNEADDHGEQTMEDELGWSKGFFAETYGALPNFPLREAQGEYETREAFSP